MSASQQSSTYRVQLQQDESGNHHFDLIEVDSNGTEKTLMSVPHPHMTYTDSSIISAALTIFAGIRELKK